MRLLCHIPALIGLMICVLGCDNPTGGIDPLPSVRSVGLSAMSNGAAADGPNRIEGTAPVHVKAIMDHSSGEGDPRNDSAILKAELDFGDGSGWTDYTADSIAKWYEEPLSVPVSDPAWMTLHTYTAPGTYVINGRMTFWDGEVIYANPGTQVTVIVNP